MSVKMISKNILRHMGDSEALILQGCGGDLDEWVDGINDLLTEGDILKDGTKFHDCFAFQDAGITCLMFPFRKDVKIDIGKLAIWRLQTHENFGGKWLSDYVPNNLGGFFDSEIKLDSYFKEYYSPLVGMVYHKRTNDGFCEEPDDIDGRSLLLFSEQISDKLSAIEVPKYDKAGSEKVRSVQWNVEQRGNNLLCKVSAQFSEPLTEDEEKSFIDWIRDENSGEMGEALENNPIYINGNRIFVSLWNASPKYFVCPTEDLQYFNDQGQGFAGL